MLELLNMNSVPALGMLGLFTFLVNIIVQLTKELPGIKNMPTKGYVILVSLVVTLLGGVIYCATAPMDLTASFIASLVLSSFVVAYASIYGFDTLSEVYGRYNKKSE